MGRPTDVLPDEVYKFVYERSPRLCLDFAVEYDHRILMTKRTNPPYKNTWNFPGGRLRFKESVEKATARILKTELSLATTLCVPRLIGFCEFLREGRGLHSFSLVFRLRLSDEEVARIRTDRQASAYEFFVACPRNMHPVHRRFALDHRLLNAF